MEPRFPNNLLMRLLTEDADTGVVSSTAIYIPQSVGTHGDGM